MTESIVRRVAGILEPQAWAALGLGDTLAYKNRRTSSLRKARAAIEAMKTPTDAMKLAGGLKCEAIMFEHDPDGTGVIFNDMGHVWQAMISTALKEDSDDAR